MRLFRLMLLRRLRIRQRDQLESMRREEFYMAWIAGELAFHTGICMNHLSTDRIVICMEALDVPEINCSDFVPTQINFTPYSECHIQLALASFIAVLTR